MISKMLNELNSNLPQDEMNIKIETLKKLDFVFINLFETLASLQDISEFQNEIQRHVQDNTHQINLFLNQYFESKEIIKEAIINNNYDIAQKEAIKHNEIFNSIINLARGNDKQKFCLINKNTIDILNPSISEI
jgi:hypothetical protein